MALAAIHMRSSGMYAVLVLPGIGFSPCDARHPDMEVTCEMGSGHISSHRREQDGNMHLWPNTSAALRWYH